MITKEFSEEVSELNKILSYMPSEYVEKIPEKLRVFFKNVESKTYIPNIDPNKPMDKQDIKEGTKDLITVIYRSYWCTKEEKEMLDKILIENDRTYEKELREKYNPDNLFKNKTTQNIKEEIHEKSLMIPENKIWYQKALRFISDLFRKIFKK